MAGDDVLDPRHHRAQPLQRGRVLVGRTLRERRNLHRGQIVAGDQHARPRDRDRHAVDGVPAGRMQLELLAGQLAASRDRQRLHRSEGQRAGTRHVVLVVEVAQGPSRRPRLRRQPGRGRLGAPQRRVGEGQPAEQVIPVAVRGEQAAEGEPRLLHQRRQDLQLVGIDRRVDDERLRRAGVRSPDDRARRLPDPASDDDDVAMQRDGAHRPPPPRARRCRGASPPRAGWPPRRSACAVPPRASPSCG